MDLKNNTYISYLLYLIEDIQLETHTLKQDMCFENNLTLEQYEQLFLRNFYEYNYVDKHENQQYEIIPLSKCKFVKRTITVIHEII